MLATADSVSHASGSVEVTPVLSYSLIALTHGYSALVDPEDFQRFGHLKWTAQIQLRKDGSVRVYAYRNEPDADGKLHNVYLHRAVVDAQPGIKFDHRDRDTLNCQKYNLRPATYSQNNCNRAGKVGRFGFIGVDSQTVGSYRGRVRFNHRDFWTPTFKTPIQAAVARDVLVRQLHGKFAVTNFPVPLSARELSSANL